MYKKIISIFLVCLLTLALFSGCTAENNKQLKTEEPTSNATNSDLEDNKMINSFELSDPELLDYMESVIYSDLLDKIDNNKYVVENIELVYISNEYIEESLYNSESNIYFGYTLAELEEQFQGKKFVFTLGDDGKTTVKAFEEYDDTYEKIIKNVAIGTGAILVRVVISSAIAMVNPATAPAVSTVFAVSAKDMTKSVIEEISSSVISEVSSRMATGIEAQDIEEILKSVALSASEEFKWSAITGLCYNNPKEYQLKIKR